LNDEYSAPHLNVTCSRHDHDIVRNKCSSGDKQQLLNYLTDIVYSIFVVSEVEGVYYFIATKQPSVRLIEDE